MQHSLAVALLGGIAHVVAVVERREVEVEEASERARDAAHEAHPERPADRVVVRLGQPLAVLARHEPDQEQRCEVDESCAHTATQERMDINITRLG